jgi:hypothetical protein
MHACLCSCALTHLSFLPPQNGTESDGTPARDASGPRARHSASLVCYGRFLYLFGGYAYGGASKFATLYPAYPRNGSGYPTLADKYYLNDLWCYSIDGNTWEKAREGCGLRCTFCDALADTPSLTLSACIGARRWCR